MHWGYGTLTPVRYAIAACPVALGAARAPSLSPASSSANQLADALALALAPAPAPALGLAAATGSSAARLASRDDGFAHVPLAHHPAGLPLA
eukprot:scaffold61692_cov73-Phaeocystis_antarctica.AAC.2